MATRRDWQAVLDCSVREEESKGTSLVASSRKGMRMTRTHTAHPWHTQTHAYPSPTQSAQRCSAARKMENCPLFAQYYTVLLSAVAAASCVNTLLGNNCFHLLHCVMQMLCYVTRCCITPPVWMGGQYTKAKLLRTHKHAQLSSWAELHSCPIKSLAPLRTGQQIGNLWIAAMCWAQSNNPVLCYIVLSTSTQEAQTQNSTHTNLLAHRTCCSRARLWRW